MYQNNFPVPSYIPVNYNVGTSVEEKSKSKSVVADTTKNRMLLIESACKWDRTVNENHPNFSMAPSGVIANNISRVKTQSEEIASGAFEVVKKHKIINPDGNFDVNKSYLEVNFYIKGHETFSSFFRISELLNDKAICKFLMKNCIFFEKSYGGILANHFRVSGHQLKEEESRIGIEANLESAEYIPDSSEIAEGFGLFTDTPDEELVDAIVTVSICCIVKTMSMWTNEVLDVVPTVVYITPDFEVLNEICEIFRVAPEVFSKETFNNILNTVDDATVVSAEGVSAYKRKSLIQKLGMIQTENPNKIWSLPIILDTKTDIYDDISNILIIPYKMLEIYNVPDVGMWFCNILNNNKDSLLRYHDYCSDMLYEEGYIGATLCDFVASIEATAHLILEVLKFDSAKKSAVLQKLHEHLTTCALHEEVDCVSDFIKYIRKKQLPVLDVKNAFDREKYPIFLVNEKKIYIDKITLTKIATDMRTSFKGLRNSLKQNNFLTHDSMNPYQLNKNFNNGGSERFYAIDQNKIYSPGEVRLHADNFAEKRPDIMIPIGYCGDETIHFVINSIDEMLNNHTSVLGNSGSGKTYLIANFVMKAAEEGIDTYIVGKTDAEITYLDDNLYKKTIIRHGEEIEISDEECDNGKIFAFYVDADADGGYDRILGALWAKLSKREHVKPVFVVVDEAHELNLAQNSVFVKKFLKQGRKFGIMVIMSTQVTNSEIAKNLTSVMTQFTTVFEFRTSDSNKSMHNLKIDRAEEGYSEIKKDLLELEIGTCYAKGNLATDKDYIRYPVKVHIEGNK